MVFEVRESIYELFDVDALLRITQISAIGGDVNIINFIGKHECSKVPHLYLMKTEQ